MNGIGGNSTNIFDRNDNDDGPALASVAFSLLTLAALLVGLKALYEKWVSPLSDIPGAFLSSITSAPMRYRTLRGELPEFLLAAHRRHGPIARVAPHRVSVADPEIIRHVLGSHAFAKAGSYDVAGALEPNVFSTRQPQTSAQRRRLLGPAFAHRGLAQCEDALRAAAVHSLRTALDAETEGGSATVDVHRLFALLALDAVAAAAFGRQLGALEAGGHELATALVRVRALGSIAAGAPWVSRVPRLVRGRLEALAVLLGFSQMVVDERRGGARGADLLQAAMGGALTDAQAASEGVAMLLAGVDTTAAALTWTLVLLMHNAHVYRRLVRAVRGSAPCGECVSYAQARAVPLLAAVVSESLRVMSPVPGTLPRVAPPGGVRLGGYYLPAGTWICCSIGAAHMNPAAFADPHVFDPARFLGDAGARAQANLLAFSTGVRACLGRSLAGVVLHLVLANLLRDYDLQPVGGFAATGEKPDGDAAPGVVPDIPRRTYATMNPTHPERDCLVVVSRADWRSADGSSGSSSGSSGSSGSKA